MATERDTESYLTKDATGQIGGQLRLVSLPGRIETVNYAINGYSYLIQRNERITPQEFVRRIRKAYDCDDCPQNKAVVDALECLI